MIYTLLRLNFFGLDSKSTRPNSIHSSANFSSDESCNEGKTKSGINTYSKDKLGSPQSSCSDKTCSIRSTGHKPLILNNKKNQIYVPSPTIYSFYVSSGKEVILLQNDKNYFNIG